MTVPRASQFCCLSLKFVNQVWVWVHFVLLVFAYLTTISIGAIRLLKLNYDDYTTAKDEILRIIEKEIKVEINEKCYLRESYQTQQGILNLNPKLCHLPIKSLRRSLNEYLYSSKLGCSLHNSDGPHNDLPLPPQWHQKVLIRLQCEVVAVLKMMKFAAIPSINCFDIKKISIILCWIDFIASILGVVAAAAFGFVGIIIVNDEQQKHLIADYISQYLTVNSDVICIKIKATSILQLTTSPTDNADNLEFPFHFVARIQTDRRVFIIIFEGIHKMAPKIKIVSGCFDLKNGNLFWSYFVVLFEVSLIITRLRTSEPTKAKALALIPALSEYEDYFNKPIWIKPYMTLQLLSGFIFLFISLLYLFSFLLIIGHRVGDLMCFYTTVYFIESAFSFYMFICVYSLYKEMTKGDENKPNEVMYLKDNDVQVLSVNYQ
ncbi:unnamed protein product [Chironomus riparius]|uniref:Uncharacterized protein n=1 Tax=Chironomus riparius TaxID=315576 RepID=A0A9N9S552_9DIPT|nr:unnamed protein product [Chironomus riparius]